MTNDDEYINIDCFYSNNLNKIYQIQLFNDIAIVKLIAMMNNCPDILIQENFGKKKNLNLYNCVYTINELEQSINSYFPIIKLIDTLNNIVFSIVIEILDTININENIIEFNLFLIINKNNNQKFEKILLEKNINPNNIIELFLEKIIYCNYLIF